MSFPPVMQPLLHTCWQLIRCVFLFVVLLISAPFILAENPKENINTKEVPVIGLVLQGLDSVAYQQLEALARAYCQDSGVKEQPRCQLVSGGSLDTQNAALQKQWLAQLLLRKVDALVVDPVSTKPLITKLIEARKRGIPVVNIGSSFDPELLARNRLSIPSVGPDNTSAARTLASYLAKAVGAGGKVVILAGSPGEPVSYIRVSSAKRVLQAAGVNIVDVASAGGDETRAQEILLQLLKKYPDLNGVFAANGSMALGAMRAGDLKGVKLKIVGFDNGPRLLDYVRAGKILATIDWHPERQGVYAIEKLLSGKLVEDRRTPWRLLVQSDLAE